MKKKTNEEKEKKSELTGLTLQTKLTCQTRDSCHESLITKQKKTIDGLTRQVRDTCHESLIIKYKEI